MSFFSPIVLFFFLVFSLIWLIIPMISSATSTVRGSCTEERQKDTRRLSSLSFFFFFGGGGEGVGRGGWGFDWKMQVKVYDTKYVTVCTSCLLSVCHSLTLASDGRGNASPKYSQEQKSHEADGVHSENWKDFQHIWARDTSVILICVLRNVTNVCLKNAF